MRYFSISLYFLT